MAVSRRIPVGSPLSSRSMRPPEGSGVPRSMPAARSAALETHAECPSLRRRYAGLPADVWSRRCRVGKAGSGHASLYQPDPMSQPSFGKPFAHSFTRASASRRSDAPVRSTVSLRSAIPSRWMCESIRPGHATPRSLTTSALRPAASRAFGPTAMIRPSKEATSGSHPANSTGEITNGAPAKSLAQPLISRGFQRPYDLAMISFMISSVPAPIRASLASRHARSTGNSRM